MLEVISSWAPLSLNVARVLSIGRWDALGRVVVVEDLGEYCFTRYSLRCLLNVYRLLSKSHVLYISDSPGGARLFQHCSVSCCHHHLGECFQIPHALSGWGLGTSLMARPGTPAPAVACLVMKIGYAG
jgi:hypothetical protein